jgi:hypothetical protein
MQFLLAISYISKISCPADIFWWTQGPHTHCFLTALQHQLPALPSRVLAAGLLQPGEKGRFLFLLMEFFVACLGMDFLQQQGLLVDEESE